MLLCSSNVLDQKAHKYITEYEQHKNPPQLQHHDLPPRPPPKQPQPLKQPPSTRQEPSSQHIQAEFTVGPGSKQKPPRPLSGKKSNRPTSAHKTDHRPPSSSSSVMAYTKLKNSGLLQRPMSGKLSDGANSHSCTRCNRAYDNPKDLEIHQMYCY